MARQKSDEKRQAILSAATEMFAERGLGAPTSVISRAAGIAEGTLFTYFKTKDELVNALYRDIKLDLADAMMTGFPRKASVRSRFHHVWNQYVEWGRSNPGQHQVLKQIEVWGGLTEESKVAGAASFGEIQTLAEDAVAQHIVQDLPQRFIAATMTALAETIMELARQEPENAELYQTSGFEMLWAGIARKC